MEDKMLRRILLDHPRSVGESYAEHFLFAIRMSGLLILAGLAAFVHACIPALFERTASEMISRLCAQMDRRSDRSS